MNPAYAFILKLSTKGGRALFFDKQIGTFEAFLDFKAQVFNGLLVKYQLNNGFVKVVEKIPSNFYFGFQDLQFYHFILEVIYNFIPIGMDSDQVFNLMQFIYISFDTIESNKQRKFIIFNLFTLLGAGANETKYPNLLTFSKFPIDRMVHCTIDLEIEEELNAFIRETLDSYKITFSFKTGSFLKEVGIL